MSRHRDRGVPGEEVPPVPVGDALAQIGEELGLGDPAVLGTLTARWGEVVGDAIAHHARIRALRGTVLTVGVEAGPWATELRYLEREALTRVEAIVGPGVVTELRVAVDAPGDRRDAS
jgi:predicted nucleic acid-binding Zn ribbon protein